MHTGFKISWIFAVSLSLAGPAAQAKPHVRHCARARHRAPSAREKAKSVKISVGTAWNYFHPAWEDSRSLFTARGQEARPGDAVDRYLYFLTSDPKHRIEPVMHVPAYIRDRVLFWISIYARYPSHVRLVHDRDTPNVIYGYLDYEPLYRERLTPFAREVKMRAIEREVLSFLRSMLAEATGIARPRILSEDERRRLFALMAPLNLKDTTGAKHAIAGLRTQTGQSDIYQLALERGQPILPAAEQIFRQSHVPVGLTRIPFVESSFNNRARSKAGAFGIWQFTPIAARDFLPRHQRKAWRDPQVQAQAAARLLRFYRRMLPDWGTTVTAYNAGVGTMHKLVRRAHARSFREILEMPDSHRALGFAGRNFYSEFLAASVIEAYKTQVFIPWLSENPPGCDEIPPAPLSPPSKAPVLAGFSSF